MAFRERSREREGGRVMKRILTVAVAAIFVIAMTGTGFAFTAGTVSVTGTVVGKCKVGTGTTDALDFGSLDPDLNTAANSPITGSITMYCTKGYSGYVISAASTNGGTGDCSAASVAGSLVSGASAIPYTIDCSKPAGAGFGAEIDLAPTVTIGSIPVDALYSAHTDTITITVTP